MNRSSENTKCSKCWADYITTRYESGRMKRRCVRCGYSWEEWPMDYTSEKEGKSSG